MKFKIAKDELNLWLEYKEKWEEQLPENLKLNHVSMFKVEEAFDWAS